MLADFTAALNSHIDSGSMKPAVITFSSVNRGNLTVYEPLVVYEI